MASKTLARAKSAKEDEFYTQLSDISNELKNYRSYFKDKVVFCNCDDPYESNFFKYFALNFNQLGLRKLIATCYNGSPVSGNELTIDFGEPAPKIEKVAYKVEITEVKDMNNDGAVNLLDIQYILRHVNGVISKLQKNGDFRSPECVELLKEADIVVTNPPFSLFREYVAQLMEYGKKFLILGNQNAVTYKEIFTLIKDNKVWLGYKNGNMCFTVPAYYEPRPTRFWIDETGQKWRSLGNICWLTNLETRKRHEDLVLYRMYNAQDYPKYDNYDAINVDKVTEIPCDYEGVMGVPITFLDKYNPEQFEILDARDFTPIERLQYKNYALIKDADGAINGKATYARILIRRKK